MMGGASYSDMSLTVNTSECVLDDKKQQPGPDRLTLVVLLNH